MAKDTFYFSHDYNPRNDPKIKKLLIRHGMTGYGIFWAIVEDLYQNDNQLSADYESIAYSLHEKTEVVKSVINDFNLFIINDLTFSSLSVGRRLERRNIIREKAKESANARWNKPMRTHDDVDANALPPQSERNASVMLKESKEKERIINAEFFDWFWALYGKSRDKEKCRDKILALSKDDRDLIYWTLEMYIADTPDKKYRKDPIRYLTNKTWKDYENRLPHLNSGNPQRHIKAQLVL